jgi:hypothetical protein
MAKKPPKHTQCDAGKSRINVSLDRDIQSMIKRQAKSEYTSVSGLITMWVKRHEAENKKSDAERKNPPLENDETKSSDSPAA